MLQEIFYWLFSMSITAAITGVLILLVRSVKSIPRRLAVFLWAIPFLRMTVPFGLGSKYSLMSLISKFTAKAIVVYQPTEDASFSMMNFVMAADTYFPITYKANSLENIFFAASVIWSIVTFIILLMLVITYFTSLYEVRDPVHLRDNIYLSEKLDTPAVYGIIKPKIILPLSCGHGDIELIILHEKMHIRSVDNLWRILAFVIVSVHWFNPFCWLFLRLFLADLELSCDERVISRLDDERKKKYALLLLESSKKKPLLTSAFGGAKIRKRIENILSFRKMTFLSITVFAVFIGIIFYVLLTNAG